MVRNDQLMLDILLSAEQDKFEEIEIPESSDGKSFRIMGNDYTLEEYSYHAKLLRSDGYISAPNIEKSLSGTGLLMGMSYSPVLTSFGHNKISEWRRKKSQNPGNSRAALPPSEW